jgi:hypothetical protein
MLSNDYNRAPNSFVENANIFDERRRKTENPRKENLLHINSSVHLNAELKGTQVSGTKTLKST